MTAGVGSLARSRSRDQNNDGDTEEKQGFFDKLKKKVNQAREDKKERDAEKERAKSPTREMELSSSKQSLSAVANESISPVRPSVIQQTIPEMRENDNTLAEAAMVQKTELAENRSAEPIPSPPVFNLPPTATTSTPIVPAASTTFPAPHVTTATTQTPHETSNLNTTQETSTATQTSASPAPYQS